MPRSKLRLAIVVALLLIAGGCASVGGGVPGIDNFDEVQAGSIYRGAQPARAGIETLKSRGVRTIINLRHDPQGWEEKQVVAAGINYIWIPMFASDVKPAQVDDALSALASAQRPIFIHCRLGRDRTGLAVGAFRIVQQDWTQEQAIKELYDHGYNWALYPGIERYLRTLEKKRRPI